MGSPTGIWTAVSGGMAQSQNLDITANNLANVNTTGFKKDTPTFKEYLTAFERPPSPDIDIPRTIFKDSDFYHHDGREHAFVNLDRVHTDHSQGSFKGTNAPFDLAIDGPGFFVVKGPNGTMYSRAGDFKVDGTGKLVTNDGFPVMALGPQAAALKNPDLLQQQQQAGAPNVAATRNPASVNPFTGTQAPGQPPLLQEVNLRDFINQGQKINITPEGQIYSEDQLIGVLAIAEFPKVDALKKEASTLYSNPDGANVPKVGDVSRVRQGFLEMSNVNAVSELVNLIKVNRMFESNMRAIKTYSEMSGKEANEVGKL